MRKTPLILLASVAASLAGGGFLWTRQQAAAIVTPETRPAQTAASARRVVALGRIEPQSEIIKIAAPAGQDAGRIAEIRVAEGEQVEKGAIVAKLDTEPRLRALVQQAEGTLQLRRASLAKTIADLANQERTLAAAMEQQEAQRDRAKWELDRLQQLQRSGIYRDTALIDKRLALEGSEHALASARLHLERNRTQDANGIRIDEASARAEVAVAEAALAKAQADLAFGELRSPIAGRVLRRIGRIGEQIGQDGLMEIADTRVMFARTEVFEGDIAGIAPGMAASIASRALAEPVNGVVHRIGLKVNRQTMIGEDPAAALDARVVEVLIRLDEPGSQRTEALTGLQVRATFLPAAGS